MTNFLEIQWTSGSLDEARKISRYLVQERYVASAQIVPWIESIYMLNNQLETAQESKIILKAPASNFDKIKEVITTNSSYQIAEIIFTKIEGGAQKYLDWMVESAPVEIPNSNK